MDSHPFMALLSFLINFSGCSVFRSCPHSGAADQTALNKCLWTLLSRAPLIGRAGSHPKIFFPWFHFLSAVSFPFGRTAAHGVIIPGQRMEPVLSALEVQTFNRWTTREVPFRPVL